jgi:hypothetical protein
MMLFIRLGETLVLDNRILCRVLFLHRGKVHEFSPHKDFEILGRDQFPCKGCQLGATLSMFNGTSGKAQYLCQLDQLGETPSKIFGTQWREKSLHNPCHPITIISRRYPSEHSFCTLVKTTVSTRTLVSNPTFPSNLVPVKLQAPFFLYIVPNPNYCFWKRHTFQTCQY